MPPKSGATGPKPKKSTPKSSKTTELNSAPAASPSEEKPSSSKKTRAVKKVSATKKAAPSSRGTKKTSEAKTSSTQVEVKSEGAKAAASETKRGAVKKTPAKAASATKKASGTKTTSTKATVAKTASVAKATTASPVKGARTVKAGTAKKTASSGPKASKSSKAKVNDAVESVMPTDDLVAAQPEVVPEVVETAPAVAPVEKIKKTKTVSKKTTKKEPKTKTAAKKTSVRRTRKPPTVGDNPLTPEQVEEFKASLTGSYKFSVPSMLTLLEVFSSRGSLKDEEGMKVVGVETTKRYNEYRNFLFTGSLINYEQPAFVKTADLDAVWTALQNQDAKGLCKALVKVPSFNFFLKGLKLGTAVRPGEIPEISKSAFPTYCTLVEMTGQGLSVSSEGVYATPIEPTVDEFVKMARETYKNLSAKKDKAVSAGLWLETIAKTHGVHPLVTRRLLTEAQEQGILKYALEENGGGALPKKVSVYYISRKDNLPILEQANLYSGEFLFASKTAVNLRLENKGK